MFKLVSKQMEEGEVVSNYEGKFTVALAGDSLWSNTSGKTVEVTGATVVESEYEGETSTLVYVAHTGTWDIYTDTGFERAISEALGYSVRFTEQGMQEDNYASLEA